MSTGRLVHAEARKASARALGESFATSSAILGANVLTGILLARTLGVEDRGELAAVLLWPGLLATLGSLGVVEAVAFHAARSTSTVASLAGTSVVLAAGQGALLVGVGLLVVPLVLSGYGAESMRAGLVFLACIPLHLLALYLMAILSGLHRFGCFQALRLLTVGATAAWLVAAGAAGVLTVTNAMLGYLGANFATCVVAALLVRRAGARRLSTSPRLVRELLRFGIRSHVSTVSATLNERLDQLVISVVLGPLSLGLYAVAVTLSSVATLVGSSAALIALPAVARLRGEAERADAARRLVLLTAIGSALVTAPILVLAPELLTSLFGPSFAPAADVTRLLLVASVLLATGRSLSAVLKGAGRPLDAGVAEVVALAVTVAGLAAFLPSFGLLGAGLASLIAYGVGVFWLAARAGRALGLSPAALVFPRRSDVAPVLRALQVAARGAVR